MSSQRRRRVFKAKIFMPLRLLDHRRYQEFQAKVKGFSRQEGVDLQSRREKGTSPTPTLFAGSSWFAMSLLGANQTRPVFIGVNGPQGSGKTTLTASLVEALHEEGLSAVSVSIDDFYLTRAEQVDLAERRPENPLLQQRGYPGTHDIELGTETLLALQQGERVRVPRYDKSMHSGHGDRKPVDQWFEVAGRQDVVFLEGWMLGFQPAPLPELWVQQFSEINELLKSYAPWLGFLDALIILFPEKIDFIQQWRIGAEDQMRSRGLPAMSVEEITAYIRKFLPAYEIYLPGLLAHPPISPSLVVQVGANRIEPNAMTRV